MKSNLSCLFRELWGEYCNIQRNNPFSLGKGNVSLIRLSKFRDRRCQVEKKLFFLLLSRPLVMSLISSWNSFIFYGKEMIQYPCKVHSKPLPRFPVTPLDQSAAIPALSQPCAAGSPSRILHSKFQANHLISSCPSCCFPGSWGVIFVLVWKEYLENFRVLSVCEFQKPRITEAGKALQDHRVSSKNSRMVWVEREFNSIPFHPATFHHPRVLQTLSSLALDTSRDGDPKFTNNPSWQPAWTTFQPWEEAAIISRIFPN